MSNNITETGLKVLNSCSSVVSTKNLRKGDLLVYIKNIDRSKGKKYIFKVEDIKYEENPELYTVCIRNICKNEGPWMWLSTKTIPFVKYEEVKERGVLAGAALHDIFLQKAISVITEESKETMRFDISSVERYPSEMPQFFISETTKYTNEKETKMSIKLETKTYFNGTDVTNMSDNDIFEAISMVEDEADKLEIVMTKSNKLSKRIKELNEIAEKLADIVDAR